MNTPRAWRAMPFVISLIALVLIFGLLYAWRAARAGTQAPKARPPALVATVRVQPRPLGAELQAIGTLQAVQEVRLAPDTAGRVTAIHFSPGQFVQQGAVLVQLYDAPEQADRAAALARAELAQAQWRRAQELATTGAESRERLEQRKSEADQAAAAVQQLDARIQQKVIRAPFSGQIGIRRINLGQVLNPGDAVATLTQLDPLYVNFTLPQQELPRLAIGASVRVAVDAAPGRVFEARVSTIEPRIDGDTRNVAVQALLSNAEGRLKSGMYATLKVMLPSAGEALVLPLTAIQTSASGNSVVLVRGVDAQGVGKAEFVQVATGQRVGEDIEVTRGIQAGDLVVMAGQNRLQPGGSVKLNGAPVVTAGASAAH